MSQTFVKPDKDCTKHQKTKTKNTKLVDSNTRPWKRAKESRRSAKASCFGLSTTNRHIDSTYNKNNANQKYTASIIVEIEDCHGNIVPIKALLDTGTDESLVLKEFVRKSRAQCTNTKRVTWTTVGGEFSTKRQALLDFSFPELAPNKKITWIMHVDDKTSREKALYDMIIGMNLMTEIGITVDTIDKVIRWEGNIVPLKTKTTLQT
jgi:hypothetical protein